MTTEPNGAVEAAAEDTAPAQEPEATITEAPEALEPGSEASAEQQPKPQRPKLTAQQRIDQLTWAKNEAERRAQEAEARAQEFEARYGQAPQATPPAQGAEPNPEDFAYGATDPQYIAELAVQRATARVRQEFEARQAQEREIAARQDFAARRNAFAAKVTDNHEGALALLNDTNAPVTREMAEVLFASEAGVQVADHLGRNYAEARRIASLPPHLQGVELGRLEARLNTPPKTATDAPVPAPMVRGAGGKFQVAPDTASFADFDKQYGLD